MIPKGARASFQIPWGARRPSAARAEHSWRCLVLVDQAAEHGRSGGGGAGRGWASRGRSAAAGVPAPENVDIVDHTAVDNEERGIARFLSTGGTMKANRAPARRRLACTRATRRTHDQHQCPDRERRHRRIPSSGWVSVRPTRRCSCENVIRAGQAACSYSWRMPLLRRSCLRMCRGVVSPRCVIGVGNGRSGRAFARPWCGRWVL